MSAICPNCGFDQAEDAVIETAGLLFDPRGQILVGGEKINLTKAERLVLHCILKGNGRILSRDLIAKHAGSVGVSNSIEVILRRTRQKLGPLGSAIESVRGLGWRWAPFDQIQSAVP